jgi:hypothetical protein
VRIGGLVGRTDSLDPHVELRVAGGEERLLLITTGVSYAP